MKRRIALFVAVIVLTVAGSSSSHSQPTIVNSYPGNGSTDIPTTSAIGITCSGALSASAELPDNVRITGRLGKQYQFTSKLSRDRRTLLLTPTTPFAYGEQITVSLGALRALGGASSHAATLTFKVKSCEVAPPASFHSDDPILERMLQKHRSGGSDVMQPLSAPTPPSWPGMRILADSQASVGSLYLANFRFGVTPQVGAFRTVLSKNGEIVSAVDGAPNYYLDFKPLGDGRYSCFDALNEVFLLLDSSFRVVDSIKAVNGYETDGHELRITPDGGYAILAVEYVKVDMSKIIDGGDTGAVVLAPVIQEFDAGKNLVFEWRSIERFQVTDASNENLIRPAIDFCHANAIEFDADSNVVLSSRHMDEITKIDRHTGEIIWRWGGRHNQFTFVGDTTPFSHQHAIRRIANGHFTMFDNGNDRGQSIAYSRAAEFELDQSAKTAYLVWQYRHTPDMYGFAMGYVQRLSNGNTLIGWGACSLASVTEVDSAGATRFEMAYDSSNYSYRAYKYDSTFNRVSESASVSSLPTAINSVACYPDPVSRKGIVVLNLLTAENVSAELYDGVGRCVETVVKGRLSAGPHELALDAAALANGLYLLHVNFGSGESRLLSVLVAH